MSFIAFLIAPPNFDCEGRSSILPLSKKHKDGFRSSRVIGGITKTQMLKQAVYLKNGIVTY